jgi:hypothetical protein
MISCSSTPRPDGSDCRTQDWRQNRLCHQRRCLAPCLDDAIALEVVEGIGQLKDELKTEAVRVAFKDNGFQDDVAKTNAMQILKRYGIDDVKSI